MSDSRYYDRRRAITRRKAREHQRLRPRRPYLTLYREVIDGELEYSDVRTARGTRLDYVTHAYLHRWDALSRVHRRPRRKNLEHGPMVWTGRSAWEVCSYRCQVCRASASRLDGVQHAKWCKSEWFQ